MKTFTTLNKWVVLGLFLTSMSFLSSCCEEMYCFGAEDLNQINFYNFNIDDLDSISVKKFAKNSNFTNLIDSSFAMYYPYNNHSDYAMVNITPKLEVVYDYEIELLSTGQVYRFSNFQVEKKKCNEGFMCRDFFYALTKYQVNGIDYQYYDLRVYN